MVEFGLCIVVTLCVVQYNRFQRAIKHLVIVVVVGGGGEDPRKAGKPLKGTRKEHV